MHDVFPGSTFQLRSETEVITDVVPAAKLYSERACRATMMNVEERDEAARLHSRPIWRTAQAICQSVDGAARFGYNWISLVRYCKYWQPGKLPTQ